MSRFVRPETVKLEISQGDWLLVKRRLTAGEARHAFARIVKQMVAGQRLTLDFEQTGLAKMVAYLLDWSLGAEAPIRDQPTELVEQALLALDPESFREIQQAIDDHEEREAAALAEEKKRTGGASVSSATSTSVA